ncbi:MAG: transglycosylase domain-containing protein [Snowella sp.]|nr:transglycosylase domain-containing protein [Snowella sp.]
MTTLVVASIGTEIKIKSNVKVPKLEIKYQKKVKIYPIIGDHFTVGRGSSCDIVLDEEIISKIHCSFQRNKTNRYQFQVTDENSTNGTFINREKINSIQLKHNDRITLGPPEVSDAPTLRFFYDDPIWLKTIYYALYTIAGISTILIGAIASESSKVVVKPLPSGVIGPTVIYAKNGVPLNPFQQEAHRELNNLKDFSPYLVQAVVASEDSRFYWHFGVDPLGIIRAIIVNSKGKNQQGGSTLTQQLARSLFPEVGRQNTASRKWREMAVSFKLETVYRKSDLLKVYLNRIYLGLNHYGFEDAAQFYFDKSAKDLDISESATLVAMLPAPNLYNPVRDINTSVKKRDIVIKKMAQIGVISAEEANRAMRSRIRVSPKARQSSSIIAPYFYDYVLTEMQQILGDELSSKGNWIIETSLDLNLQNQAEKTLQKNINNQGKRFNYSQGSLVTLNARNGEILALVGGKDYKSSQYNRATQAKRQPGSTFKLFTYTSAIKQGIYPNNLYSCNALTWQGQNFKPCEHSTGEVTMTQGFARSENAVALRVAQQVGLDSVINLAASFGIRINSKLTSSPGLVLGQSETTVLAMTGAYAAIANQGIWNKPHAIRRILDGSDCINFDEPQTCRVIYDVAQEPDFQHQAVSGTVASTMMTMLRQPVIAGTAQAANRIPDARGKTGTTNNGVDLWFMGILPQKHLVTGIWLGNDDNQPTRGNSAQAVTLWASYSQQLLNP